MSSRYARHKVLGRGNYGAAHLVRDNRSQAWYVMKEIALEGLDDRAKDNALAEAALLAHMSHFCIVKYRDSFTSKNHLYIVMEYCEGGDLSRKIKNQKKLKVPFLEEQVLDWFTQLTTAIAYCHGKRVLHRDLKPGNVFLTATNQVKLGDFGIARVLENTMDKAQTVAGTPYFMSPEVCENKPYGAESDIWALGCILYEMCTLRHPFEATNLLGLVFKIVTEEPKPIPEAYSPSLWQLIQQMLHKAPSQRPTALQVLEHPLCKLAAERLATSGGTTHEATSGAAASSGGGVGGADSAAAGHVSSATGIQESQDGLTPQERRRRRKQEAADKRAAELAAATVAAAEDDAAAAAANRAKNHTTSHWGQARAQGSTGSAQTQHSAKTPRRGPHRVVHTAGGSPPPATAPAASGGATMSPGGGGGGGDSQSTHSARSSARSVGAQQSLDSRPIVSTGKYNLDGIAPAEPSLGGVASGGSGSVNRQARSNSGANTPGAHRRKGTGRELSVQAPVASGSSAADPAHTPGFSFTGDTQQTSGAAGVVAVKRTPRVRSRGSSRPVSADGMMMFQSEGHSRGSSPATGSRPSGRRAKSSMAKVHSAAHMSAARPTATFALHDEDSDGEEQFMRVAKGDGVYTDAAPSSHSSRARSAASHFPARNPPAHSAPVEHTVDDDYASDDFEEDSEALQLAVPEYQATLMVARNAERNAMQQHFRAAAEHPGQGAARSVPGAGGTAGSGADPPLDAMSPSGGSGDQPALQLDVRSMLAAEGSRQAATASRKLGKPLFDKAVSFWRDAYTKGGGAAELAKPDVAAKVRRTIEALCAQDQQKVGAFYQVEAMVWSQQGGGIPR